MKLVSNNFAVDAPARASAWLLASHHQRHSLNGGGNLDSCPVSVPAPTNFQPRNVEDHLSCEVETRANPCGRCTPAGLAFTSGSSTPEHALYKRGMCGSIPRPDSTPRPRVLLRTTRHGSAQPMRSSCGRLFLTGLFEVSTRLSGRGLGGIVYRQSGLQSHPRFNCGSAANRTQPRFIADVGATS